MAISFKDLRQELTDEMLKDILLQFDVEPYEETSDYIIIKIVNYSIVSLNVMIRLIYLRYYNVCINYVDKI